MNNSTNNGVSKRMLKLLNFVKEHNPVARLLNDDETIQIVCPERDTNGDFVHLYAEAGRGRRIILHDDCFAATVLLNLDGESLLEVNDDLAKYGIPPLDSPRARLEIQADPNDFAEKRDALAKAVFSIGFGQMVRKARLRAMRGESPETINRDDDNRQAPSRQSVYLRGFLQEHHLLAKVMADGETVQVICPELDSDGDFIHLYVERGKGRGLVLHDAGYFLKTSISLTEDNLPAVNEILEAYGIPPISSIDAQIVVNTDRVNYPDERESLLLAIAALERAYAHTRCQVDEEEAAELRDSLIRVG